MTTPSPQKSERRRRWGRALVLWTILIPPVLCLLLLGVVSAGGWWLERIYLRDEIRFGTNGEGGAVHVHGARFDWWRLNVNADSIWFKSPTLDARTGTTSVRIDWINGLLAMRPAARLDIDTVWVAVRGDTTVKEKTPLDSIILPDFSLPIAIVAQVRRLALEDSAGLMLTVQDARVSSRGGKRMRARVGQVQTRWSGDLALAALASLNWTRLDSVDVAVTVRRETDSVVLIGRHAKSPVWHGHDSLAVMIADVSPYYQAFGLGVGIPRTAPNNGSNEGGIKLTATAMLGDSLGAKLQIRAALAEWTVNPEFTLSPQRMELTAAWMQDRGTAVLSSDGRDGENIRLSLTARIQDPEGFVDSTKPLHEQVSASLEGHARGLRVRVRDTLRTADATIERAAWNGRTLDVAVSTGDSSRIEATAMLAGPLRSYRGSLRAAVRPDERWVKVFIGEAVTFKTLDLTGAYDGGYSRKSRGALLTATLAGTSVNAYGVILDSLRSAHEYDLTSGRYSLTSSRLYASSRGRPDVWALTGTVTPPRIKRQGQGVSVEARLAANGRGALFYDLGSDGTMEATAEDFTATALPYEGIDSLPIQDGVLDGVFRWNPTRKTGFSNLTAKITYLRNDPRRGSNRQTITPEPVEATLNAEWTGKLFTLRKAQVVYRGSEITAQARLKPQGRQFYELHKVPAAQYEFAAVQTERFDLADILKTFLPEPPLDSGIVRGGLSFSDVTGFAGRIGMEHIVLHDSPLGIGVPLLRIEGRGDTLVAFARTTGDEAPWLNDSVHAVLTGARGDNQHLMINAMMDGSLRMRAEAVMQNFANLKGTLRADGSLTLPEAGGTIEAVKAFIDFDFPDFKKILENSSLTTHEFTATYVNPGQPRQKLTLDPTLRNGTIQIPNLRIENDAGQKLTGHLEFSPTRSTLTAHVEGARFAAQWTDDYAVDLTNLVVDVNFGPQGSRARGSFSSGTFTYANLPLRVQGRLGSAKAEFIRPPLPPGGARYDRRADTLKVSGVLQESELRYRLRNLGDIQRLMRGSATRRPTVGTPLHLDVKVRTAGSANRISTDMARLTWVGDLAVRGQHPYTLYEGRASAQSGDFGLEREAYAIRRLDVKWLNVPVDEGEIHFEARKELASTCTQSTQAATTDSCTVITRLDGLLNDMQFSYDSDCGGAYGAGANVAAILYSVQRGCYDASIAGGETRGYGERAITLLEPTISREINRLLGPFWGAWVETADFTGLGSLSPDASNTDSVGEALSLALTSREYRRLRIKIRSGYHLNSQDLSSPMENMVALEWRLPLPSTLRDSAWRRRLDNNLRAAVSIETKPVRLGSFETDEIERKIGLFYNYAYWGEWWAKKEEGVDNAE
jgi:hypothetical protein